MQALMNGIYSKFTSSTGAGSLHADLSGQLRPYEAEQDDTFPYGVYYLISNVPAWTFDHDFEEYIIQFNIFDDDSSATDINTAYSALIALFDDTTLTVTGYTHVYMKRELSMLTREGEERGVWNYMVQYRVYLQKN